MDQCLLQGTLLTAGPPDRVLVDAFDFYYRNDAAPAGDPSLRTLLAGFIAGGMCWCIVRWGVMMKRPLIAPVVISSTHQ